VRPSHNWIWITAFVALAGSGHAGQEPRTAEDVLARMESMAAGLQDYEVNGQGEAHGKRNKFKLYFKKPDLVRIDAEDGQVSVQPNGDVRGRLGHGPFGNISRKIDRDDPRLKDDEGIPFYESHYPAMLGRMRAQLKAGATSSLNADQGAYYLELRSGDTVWKYTIEKSTLFPRENSRWVAGRLVEITSYSDFRANAGLKTGHFKF
jgi:hypothetical protein